MAAEAVDSAISQAHLRHRLASLDTDMDGLSFGRIDEEHGDAGTSAAATSRTGGATRWWSTGGPTWRSPFYRATAVDALGLSRRRRFMMTGKRLDDLFDEVFDDPDSVDAARHGGIPDPLLAELERERHRRDARHRRHHPGRAGRGHPGARSTRA